jgi:hypothetical protein
MVGKQHGAKICAGDRGISDMLRLARAPATKEVAEVVVELIPDQNLRIFLASLHEALAAWSRAHGMSPV